MSYYLGIDIGTSASKGVLLDEQLRLLATAELTHETENPQPGWFSHDADRVWWGDFCRLTRLLPERAGIASAEIACVGLSALGCDCVPVDCQGKALAKAILYGIDSRTTEELDLIRELYGEQVTERFGHIPCSSDVAPKILWFRRHMPEVWKSACKFLTASSYLCARLTGQFVMDPYLAEDFRPLYQPGDHMADPSGCAPYCRPDQLPELLPATAVAGYVSHTAAEETGLPEGTPVLTGTGDSGAEAISAGVSCPGDLLIQLGSTAYMILLADHMIEEPRLWPGSYILPEVTAICAGTNTAGTLTAWLADTFYKDQPDRTHAWDAMGSEASVVPAGSEGLICLPYFAGERTPLNDPDARGVFFGLNPGHGRGHMVRAALEGICCSIRANLELMERHGLPIHRVRVTGGGTKNPVWLQCLADVLGRELELPAVTLGAAYGDALMAAMTAGVLSGPEELSARIAPAEIIAPDPTRHALYDGLYSRFKRLYSATADLMHLCAAPDKETMD